MNKLNFIIKIIVVFFLSVIPVGIVILDVDHVPFLLRHKDWLNDSLKLVWFVIWGVIFFLPIWKRWMSVDSNYEELKDVVRLQPWLYGRFYLLDEWDLCKAAEKNKVHIQR
jgi:hypothetical protein